MWQRRDGDSMLKTFGYYLFALVYTVCRPLPVIKKRVFCIKTHDDGEGSNVSIAEKALRERQEGYSFSYIRKSDTAAVKSLTGLKHMFDFFFRKPYELARAEIVLLDNVFLPYAYIRRKKGTKVVQLWHGTGTIKKFGQDVNQGKLKELEIRANSNITHLIVNSQKMKKLYSGIFGVKENKVYPIGLPRTDEIFKRLKQQELTGRNLDREFLYHKYQIPADKKLILYAPTFRDDVQQNQRLPELIKGLCRELPQEYYLGLRLHPFIAEEFRQEKLEQRICQFSYEKDLNALIMAADILITDYSSIIFEYCITKKPMVFYAYDYEEFSDSGRGFYYDYRSFVPGPVAYRPEEAGAIIREERYQSYPVDEFIQENYLYTDGRATERLLGLLKSEQR